jgi:hypothetical protein
MSGSHETSILTNGRVHASDFNPGFVTYRRGRTWNKKLWRSHMEREPGNVGNLKWAICI